MKKRVVSTSEDSGITSYYKKQGDSIIIEDKQDVEGHLSFCREMRQRGIDVSSDSQLVATIPNIIIEKWNKELGDNCLKKEHQDFFVSKVNSPEFAAFKLTEGRV